MPNSHTFRIKKLHPHQHLWEPLEADPTFVLRPFFGGKTIYLGGKLMLFFCACRPPMNGVWACTDQTRHAALRATLPELTPFPDHPKWLYVPDTHDRFEHVATRLVELARRRDPRLGVEPVAKRRIKHRAKRRKM
jgi:hypothetical protein